MFALSTAFSLLTGAAGWYYLFYSRAATRLAQVEDQALNLRRQRLRQVGGFVMLLLAVGLFAGFNSVDPATSASAFVLIWVSVFLLLLLVVVLAMLDLRLTWRLRNRPRLQGPDSDSHPR
jgi:hypothetical protein